MIRWWQRSEKLLQRRMGSAITVRHGGSLRRRAGECSTLPLLLTVPASDHSTTPTRGADEGWWMSQTPNTNVNAQGLAAATRAKQGILRTSRSQQISQFPQRPHAPASDHGTTPSGGFDECWWMSQTPNTNANAQGLAAATRAKQGVLRKGRSKPISQFPQRSHAPASDHDTTPSGGFDECWWMSQTPNTNANAQGLSAASRAKQGVSRAGRSNQFSQFPQRPHAPASDHSTTPSGGADEGWWMSALAQTPQEPAAQ